MPPQLMKNSTCHLKLPRIHINRLTVKPFKSVIDFAQIIFRLYDKP